MRAPSIRLGCCLSLVAMGLGNEHRASVRFIGNSRVGIALSVSGAVGVAVRRRAVPRAARARRAATTRTGEPAAGRTRRTTHAAAVNSVDARAAVFGAVRVRSGVDAGVTVKRAATRLTPQWCRQQASITTTHVALTDARAAATQVVGRAPATRAVAAAIRAASDACARSRVYARSTAAGLAGAARATRTIAATIGPAGPPGARAHVHAGARAAGLTGATRSARAMAATIGAARDASARTAVDTGSCVAGLTRAAHSTGSTAAVATTLMARALRDTSGVGSDVHRGVCHWWCRGIERESARVGQHGCDVRAVAGVVAGLSERLAVRAAGTRRARAHAIVREASEREEEA